MHCDLTDGFSFFPFLLVASHLAGGGSLGDSRGAYISVGVQTQRLSKISMPLLIQISCALDELLFSC